MRINFYGLKAIYLHEMDRFRRTLGQSLLSCNKFVIPVCFSLRLYV